MKNDNNQLVPLEEPKNDVAGSVFSSQSHFETAQRMARALSESSLIPKEYQKNVPNCLIALEISQRLKASALMVMQNLYIVHGKPGWSAQYIISAINSCGKFSPLRFKFDNDKNPSECQAYAIELRTGEPLYGSNVTLTMAAAEGWINKTGSKWKTMPDQMLRYRAASFFGKVYSPEILMGFQTKEEIEDIEPKNVVATVSKAKDLMKNLEAYEDADIVDPESPNPPQESKVQASPEFEAFVAATPDPRSMIK